MLGRRPRLVLTSVGLGAAGLWGAIRASPESSLPLAAPLVVSSPARLVLDTLRRGETLSEVLARHGIGGSSLAALLAAAPELAPRRLRAGLVFEFRYGADAERAERVRTRLDPQQVLWLRQVAPARWSAAIETVQWTPSPVRVAGAVRSTLYETLWNLIPDSVLPGAERDRMIYDLADGVFGWQIDFARDLVAGDRFQILFERLVSSEGEVRYGRLLAARLSARGRLNTAFVLTDEQGRNAYYDAEGRSLRRAFKLSPVPYRITSRYSLSRFHPVLRTWRAHLGVDYRAPLGAPVSATADGTVLRAGRWGGYGLMVALRHPNGIQTRYAHLSRLARGVRPGARVAQGEVIGYAGMTGLATAPHVHYEFLKNGRHVNPSRLDLGDGTPVPPGRAAAFEAIRYHYARLLDAPQPPLLALGQN